MQSIVKKDGDIEGKQLHYSVTEDMHWKLGVHDTTLGL